METAVIILYQQNLDGQTIAGEPFSYIGECSCIGTKFTGDWHHVTLYRNNLTNADWRKARPRWSYSRDNNMKGMKTSPVVSQGDHEMMLAVLRENLPNLTGDVKLASQAAIDGIAPGGKIDFTTSWINRVYRVHNLLASDQATADAFQQMFVWPHLVTLATRMIGKGDDPGWKEDPPPDTTQLVNIEVGRWGVYLKTRKGSYAKKAVDLPQPTRPHDRWEMADLIEAEVFAATGAEVTLYIEWIKPWLARMEAQAIPRERLI